MLPLLLQRLGYDAANASTSIQVAAASSVQRRIAALLLAVRLIVRAAGLVPDRPKSGRDVIWKSVPTQVIMDVLGVIITCTVAPLVFANLAPVLAGI